MKKTFHLVTLLLLLLTGPGYGQWYQNKYHVDDINKLTREQLEESLKSSKNVVIVSACVTVVGGVFFMAGKFGWESSDEDKSFLSDVWEMIVGKEGRNSINMGIGAGLAAGGVIGMAIGGGRAGRIKATLTKNYSSFERIRISPAGVWNTANTRVAPGIRLVYTF
jgi:hypothetical protein